MPQRLSTTQAPRQHKQLRRHFIAACFRSPMKMGAVMPSSRALARALAEQVDITREGCIIELGAGTGVVTHALREADIPPERLLIIEREKQLHAILHANFHELNVLCADAMDLDKVLDGLKIKKVNAVISGMPLTIMPTAVRHAVEEQMAKAIGDDGIIIQYTYGTKSPISPGELKRYKLYGQRVRLVLNNIPPANIWMYRREKRQKPRG